MPKGIRIVICINIIIFLFTLMSSLSSSTVKAEELKCNEIAEKELVFLVDASGSMNENSKYIQEIINGITASLTSNYKIGLVIFNTDLSAEIPLLDYQSRNEFYDIINSIEFKGYTNTGLGLKSALSLFSEANSDKIIIMVSDGEIDMVNQKMIDQSKSDFVESVDIAVRNKIAIHTISIGNEIDYDSIIYTASNKTGGKLYISESNEDLNNIYSDIVFNNFNIQKSALGALASADNNKISAKIPSNTANNVKVIAISDSDIHGFQISCNASEINIYKGTRYAIADIISPNSIDVDIYLQQEKQSDVQLFWIMEHQLNADISNINIINQNDIVKAYMFFDITGNNGISILNDDYFNYDLMKLNLLYDDNVSIPCKIENDKIFADYEFNQDKIILPLLLFQYPNSNIIIESDLNIELKMPVITEPVITVIEEPKDNYIVIWIILALILIALIIVIYLSLNKNDNSKKSESNNNANRYNGKLNIYITKTKYDKDYPPLTFSLYHLNDNKQLNLKDILERCKAGINFVGADSIVFQPGEEKTLVVSNHSNCTLIKRGEILIKNKNKVIYPEEKIYIISENQEQEVELHYKSIKPKMY